MSPPVLNEPQDIITPEPRSLSSSAQLSAMSSSPQHQSYGVSVDLGTSFDVSGGPETPKASVSGWQRDRSDKEDASGGGEGGPVVALG